jgi:rhodanese-related sulfurtransferase
MRTISRTELVAELASSAPPLLLEALPAAHFEAAHLPGAKNLALDDIDALAPRLIRGRDVAVVTYCAGPTCPNPRIAAERLAILGFTNVRAYEGGKEDWLAAGLALAQGRDEEEAA